MDLGTGRDQGIISRANYQGDRGAAASPCTLVKVLGHLDLSHLSISVYTMLVIAQWAKHHEALPASTRTKQKKAIRSGTRTGFLYASLHYNKDD